MNRALAAAIAASLIAAALPVDARDATEFDPLTCKYWTDDPDETEFTCVGDKTFEHELIVTTGPGILPWLWAGVDVDGTPPTAWHLTDRFSPTGGAQNIDGFWFNITPLTKKMDIVVDCPDLECPYTPEDPVVGLAMPDIDVFFFDQFGTYLEDETGCATSADEADCEIPVDAASAYVALFAGYPTWYTGTITELRVKAPGPCTLPDNFDPATQAYDPGLQPGQETRNNGSMFQTEQWNTLAPSCNHNGANSWCQENGWPTRATPGAWGPPAEADNMVPSRCNSHPCFAVSDARRTDTNDSCYDPHYEIVDPPEPPEDPVDAVVGMVENLADTDPVEVAEDEAHWALNGTAVRWVREFTPARCSETAETAPYGCDDYWQADE